MKNKILLAATLAAFTSVASAATIVNHSNAQSPGTIVAKKFEEVIGDKDMSFFQAGNCAEAQAKFDSTTDAVFVYNADVGIAALGKGLDCPLNAKPEQTAFIGKSYLYLCTNKNNTKDIRDANTLGAASVIMSKGMIADYNSNGLHLKGVPYGGSKGVLTALIAGDIDYGFVASGVAGPAIKDGLVACPYSTDPRRDDYVGKTFNLKIPTLPIVKVFYTNSTDSAFVNKLRDAVKTDAFQAFHTKAGYSDAKTDGFTTDDIKAVQDHINNSYNYYWKENADNADGDIARWYQFWKK